MGGAYGAYLKENRARIQQSLPLGHKITDITKKAASVWKAMSDKSKAKYQDIFKVQNDAYKAAMQEFKKKNRDAEPTDVEDEVLELEDEPSSYCIPVAKKGCKRGRAKLLAQQCRDGGA